MKIGILTFQSSNNYGAILQSYALQHTIKKLNYNVETINYNCEYITKPYRLVNLKNKGLFSYIYGVLGFISYLPRKKKCDEFRKYLNYSKLVNKETVKNLDCEYDMFITGSDQVWNYRLTNFDKSYFLDFVTDNNKKNSYSASFGINKIPTEYKNEYSELLKNFNNISVREESAIEMVEDLSGKEVQATLDPTLLLTAEEWDKVIDNRNYFEEEYVLVYQLNISPEMVKFVSNLAKEKNCKIKYIPFPLGGFCKSKINLTIGPAQWLGLFKNAKYVVTDSFHGLVFSIIFHRKFFVQIKDLKVGSRIEDFLKKFQLENRLIIDGNNSHIEDGIDYKAVDNKLAIERELSINYLAETIMSHEEVVNESI